MMKEHAIMDSTRLNFLATRLVVAILYGCDFLSAAFGAFILLENAVGFAGVRAGAAGARLVLAAGELVLMAKVTGRESQLVTAPGKAAFPLFSLSPGGWRLASPSGRKNFTTGLFEKTSKSIKAVSLIHNLVFCTNNVELEVCSGG